MAVKDYIDEARQHIQRDRYHLQDDSDYYEAELRLDRKGHAIPPEFRDMTAAVGWSRLYLDSLIARINIDGFRTPDTMDADEELLDWWRVNRLDQEFPISCLETFIHGRSYISVHAPTQRDIEMGHPAEVPMFTLESPKHMWVEIDPRTGEVEWAVRFYNSPTTIQDSDKSQRFTVYLPNETLFLRASNNNRYIQDAAPVTHNLGRVPIIASLNRERIGDRWGRSEIIPELRSAQDIATRVILNMKVASDLMAVPQRLLFGVEKDAIIQNQDPSAQYKAYMAGILAFQDENAHATQFSAAELSNYTGVLSELAKIVASYTGLPPQYLSFSSENPASADAIRSAETRLVKMCELKGRMFGNTWERVMRMGKIVMEGSVPDEWQRLEAILSDPSTPTYAAKADAAMKLVAGKPIIPVEQARIDIGYSPESRAQMRLMDEEERAEYAAALLGTPSPRFPLTTSTESGDAGGGSSSSSDRDE